MKERHHVTTPRDSVVRIDRLGWGFYLRQPWAEVVPENWTDKMKKNKLKMGSEANKG